jgi:hypothetical protein
MFFYYEMAEVTLMPLIFFTIFYFFSNAGELNPGLCTCWADILPLSYFLSPKYYYYFFTLAVLGLKSGLYACKAALYCLSQIIISNLSGLGQKPLLF